MRCNASAMPQLFLLKLQASPVPVSSSTSAHVSVNSGEERPALMPGASPRSKHVSRVGLNLAINLLQDPCHIGGIARETGRIFKENVCLAGERRTLRGFRRDPEEPGGNAEPENGSAGADPSGSRRGSCAVT